MFKFIKKHIEINKAMKEETDNMLIDLQKQLNKLKEHCESFDNRLMEEVKAS